MHSFVCAVCATRFDADSSAAVTCSAACRAKRYRTSLVRQRQRLADEASAALATGDVARLERVARSTVSFLA